MQQCEGCKFRGSRDEDGNIPSYICGDCVGMSNWQAGEESQIQTTPVRNNHED